MTARVLTTKIILTIQMSTFSENKDAKWKVLMFHHDIYGSGYDHSDSDGMVLRTQLTSIIDEAGFDVVLQGHDHTYSVIDFDEVSLTVRTFDAATNEELVADGGAGSNCRHHYVLWHGQDRACVCRRKNI